MDAAYYVAGIDVHKKMLAACLCKRWNSPNHNYYAREHLRNRHRMLFLWRLHADRQSRPWWHGSVDENAVLESGHRFHRRFE